MQVNSSVTTPVQYLENFQKYLGQETITESVSEMTDKMEQIALLYAIASSDEAKHNDNWLMKEILLSVLFGHGGGGQDNGLSADEQAQMINEIISSGQPGSIAQAMGKNGLADSYSGTGVVEASVPVGSAISVTA